MTKIDKNTLLNLVQDIKVINYWIKRKETGIPKSNFYNIKKHLLNYIMLCCQNNVYNTDEVSYTINDIEINRDSDGKPFPNKLVSMTYNIGNTIFEFHRILDNTLIKIIGKENINNLEEKAYSETDEILEDIDVSSIQEKYINLINTLAYNEWCIYSYLDDYNWIKIIADRYDIYKIITEWNVYKGLSPKIKIARIKYKKNLKLEEQILVDFNHFKEYPNSVLKRLLPNSYYHIDYKITFIN